MKKAIVVIYVLLLMAMSGRPALAQQITIPEPTNVPTVGIGNVISAVVGLLLLVAAILSFLYLILGGIQWITSGGDKSAMETARNRITAAIVGLIIVAASWAIMAIIGKFIGVDILGGVFTIPTFIHPSGTGN